MHEPHACACILPALSLPEMRVYSQSKLHWANSFKLLTSIYVKIPCNFFLSNLMQTLFNKLLHRMFNLSLISQHCISRFNLTSDELFSIPTPLKKIIIMLNERESDEGRIHDNQIFTRGSFTCSLNVLNEPLFNTFYKRPS